MKLKVFLATAICFGSWTAIAADDCGIKSPFADFGKWRHKLEKGECPIQTAYVVWNRGYSEWSSYRGSFKINEVTTSVTKRNFWGRATEMNICVSGNAIKTQLPEIKVYEEDEKVSICFTDTSRKIDEISGALGTEQASVIFGMYAWPRETVVVDDYVVKSKDGKPILGDFNL